MKTLFLYIDILGFTDLIKDPDAVRRLFIIIDKAQLHRDVNFRCIAFSDTILAYNKNFDLDPKNKTNELMYLIELTQDIFLKLAGSGLFFRALITEGEFYCDHMEHIDAFFGQALIDTYRAEKNIIGTGLYLDRCLSSFNQVFQTRRFSDQYYFVYLTHFCSRLYRQCQPLFSEDNSTLNSDFPLPGSILARSELEFLIYPEIVYLRDVRRLMDDHPDPSVRAKHLATWRMYVLEYPRLIASLESHNMDAKGISDLDWTAAKNHFFNERP
jgi:hypothetical protein